MIDTDKYEGHTRGPWDIIMPKMAYDLIEIVREDVSYDQWTRPELDWITIATLLPCQKHDAQLIADAPLLLAEVKRLREDNELYLACIHASQFKDKPGSAMSMLNQMLFLQRSDEK